jgi:endonuclease-3
MPSRTPARPRRGPGSQIIDVLDRLESQHPNAWTELNFRTPFELLVATILSAQSTDAGVNQVTPVLFAKYPDARALAAADPADVERIILATGFFRAKTRSIMGMSRALVDRYQGQVPNTMEALVELPGVGRKTANVVLGHAFHIPGFPVDRHVLRVTNRIGLVKSEDPEIVEAKICATLPPERWTRASDTFILHGRRICRPKPLCDSCAVRTMCRYYATLGPKAAKRTGNPEPGTRNRRPRAKGARP